MPAIDESPTISRRLEVGLQHAPTEAPAFGLASTQSPDLMLPDVGLGELGGLEMCRRLKARGA